MQDAPRSRRPGFTIIELVVAIALLAILASFMVPRFVGFDRRRASHVIDEVVDMVTMFAHRDSLQVKQIGLWYDADNRTLQLMAMDVDPMYPDERPDWYPDAVTRPVAVPPDLIPVFIARKDGRQPAKRDWMITSRPGEKRPRLTFEIGSPGKITDIILEPTAVTAVRIDPGKDIETRESLDLDAVGRDRQDW